MYLQCVFVWQQVLSIYKYVIHWYSTLIDCWIKVTPISLVACSVQLLGTYQYDYISKQYWKKVETLSQIWNT